MLIVSQPNNQRMVVFPFASYESRCFPTTGLAASSQCPLTYSIAADRILCNADQLVMAAGSDAAVFINRDDPDWMQKVAKAAGLSEPPDVASLPEPLQRSVAARVQLFSCNLVKSPTEPYLEYLIEHPEHSPWILPLMAVEGEERAPQALIRTYLGRLSSLPVRDLYATLNAVGFSRLAALFGVTSYNRDAWDPFIILADLKSRDRDLADLLGSLSLWDAVGMTQVARTLLVGGPVTRCEETIRTIARRVAKAVVSGAVTEPSEVSCVRGIPFSYCLFKSIGRPLFETNGLGHHFAKVTYPVEDVDARLLAGISAARQSRSNSLPKLNPVDADDGSLLHRTEPTLDNLFKLIRLTRFVMGNEGLKIMLLHRDGLLSHPKFASFAEARQRIFEAVRLAAPADSGAIAGMVDQRGDRLFRLQSSLGSSTIVTKKPRETRNLVMKGIDFNDVIDLLPSPTFSPLERTRIVENAARLHIGCYSTPTGQRHTAVLHPSILNKVCTSTSIATMGSLLKRSGIEVAFDPPVAPALMAKLVNTSLGDPDKASDWGNTWLAWAQRKEESKT